MQDQIWEKLSRIVAKRRPIWKFQAEDSVLRIMTGQFLVDWAIVKEMDAFQEYDVFEVVAHNSLGVIICIKYEGGK